MSVVCRGAESERCLSVFSCPGIEDTEEEVDVGAFKVDNEANEAAWLQFHQENTVPPRDIDAELKATAKMLEVTLDGVRQVIEKSTEKIQLRRRFQDLAYHMGTRAERGDELEGLIPRRVYPRLLPRLAFPLVKFWSLQQWNEAAVKGTVQLPKDCANDPTLPFLEDANGNPVDMFRARAIRMTARDIWTYLEAHIEEITPGGPESSWDFLAALAQEHYVFEMARRCPELRFCSGNHWKARAIAELDYDSWQGGDRKYAWVKAKYLERAVRKKRKRGMNDDEEEEEGGLKRKRGKGVHVESDILNK